MKINFSNIQKKEQAPTLDPIPTGEYKAKIVSAQEKEGQNGKTYLSLKLEIEEGEHIGRQIFDNLFFSEKALPRLKLICERLGINTDGEVEITPSTFLYKRVIIKIKIDNYTDQNGRLKQKNIVDYDGYKGLNEERESTYTDYLNNLDVPF